MTDQPADQPEEAPRPAGDPPESGQPNGPIDSEVDQSDDQEAVEDASSVQEATEVIEEQDSAWSVTHAKHVHVRETYSYELNLSENSTLSFKEAENNPEGLIQVDVPYDGDRYITRRTFGKLSRALSRSGKRGSVDQDKLAVGALQIIERRTASQDIRQVLRPARAIPLEVHILGDDLPDLALLVSDRYRCVLSDEYTPDRPAFEPLWANIDVYDDHVEEVPPFIKSRDLVNWLKPDQGGAGQPYRLRDYFRGTPDYQETNLILQLTFFVGLPTYLLEEFDGQLTEPTVRLRTLSFEWPTVPGGNLEKEGMLGSERINLKYLKRLGKFGRRENPYLDAVWFYNPAGGRSTGAVEIHDIPLHLDKQQDAGSRQPWRNYITQVLIKVERPGKFYQVGRLQGKMHFQLGGLLLSGHQVRLLDENGKRVEQSRGRPVQYTTDVFCDLEIDLESSFRRRERITYWEMQFGGVDLDRTRVDDVAGILGDLGYRVTHGQEISSEPSDGSRMNSYIIECSRHEELERADSTLQLLLRSERASNMQFEVDVPGEVAARLTSHVPSDHLIIHVRGHLRNGNTSLLMGLAQLQDRLKKLFYSLADAQ